MGFPNAFSTSARRDLNGSMPPHASARETRTPTNANDANTIKEIDHIRVARVRVNKRFFMSRCYALLRRDTTKKVMSDE
jgi:hypothetical protein